MPSTLPIIFSKGKEQENAIKEFSELLSVFEEGIEKDFGAKIPFNGETMGFLNIVVGTHACNYQAFEEAVTVIVDQQEHPAFLSWVTALNDCPLMKANLPPHDKLVSTMKETCSQKPKI